MQLEQFDIEAAAEFVEALLVARRLAFGAGIATAAGRIDGSGTIGDTLTDVELARQTATASVMVAMEPLLKSSDSLSAVLLRNNPIADSTRVGAAMRDAFSGTAASFEASARDTVAAREAAFAKVKSQYLVDLPKDCRTNALLYPKMGTGVSAADAIRDVNAARHRSWQPATEDPNEFLTKSFSAFEARAEHLGDLLNAGMGPTFTGQLPPDFEHTLTRLESARAAWATKAAQLDPQGQRQPR